MKRKLYWCDRNKWDPFACWDPKNKYEFKLCCDNSIKSEGRIRNRWLRFYLFGSLNAGEYFWMLILFVCRLLSPPLIIETWTVNCGNLSCAPPSNYSPLKTCCKTLWNLIEFLGQLIIICNPFNSTLCLHQIIHQTMSREERRINSAKSIKLMFRKKVCLSLRSSRALNHSFITICYNDELIMRGLL